LKQWWKAGEVESWRVSESVDAGGEQEKDTTSITRHADSLLLCEK